MNILKIYDAILSVDTVLNVAIQFNKSRSEIGIEVSFKHDGKTVTHETKFNPAIGRMTYMDNLEDVIINDLLQELAKFSQNEGITFHILPLLTATPILPIKK